MQMLFLKKLLITNQLYYHYLQEFKKIKIKALTSLKRIKINI